MRRITFLFAVMAIFASSLVQAQQPINMTNGIMMPNNCCASSMRAIDGYTPFATQNYFYHPRMVQVCPPQYFVQPAPCVLQAPPIAFQNGLLIQPSMYGPYAQPSSWMVQPYSVTPTETIQPPAVAKKGAKAPSNKTVNAENGTKSTNTTMPSKFVNLCPRKHLFSTINMHYYKTMDCPSGANSNVLFGYKHHPVCGCRGMTPPPCNDNTPPSVELELGGDLALGTLTIEQLKRMAEAKEEEFGLNKTPKDLKVPTPILNAPTEDLD